MGDTITTPIVPTDPIVLALFSKLHCICLYLLNKCSFCTLLEALMGYTSGPEALVYNL